MGKTIELRLSDAQHAALTAEAEASGRKFFDWCRAKLLNEVPIRPSRELVSGEVSPRLSDRNSFLPAPRVARAEPKPVEPVVAVDRISRIEDAVARLTDMVLQRQPVMRDVLNVGSGTEVIEVPPVEAAEPIDVDDLVAQSLAAAEAQGLTEPQIEEGQGEMPQSGVRSLMRRPTPFSRGTQIARLDQMFGAQ